MPRVHFLPLLSQISVFGRGLESFRLPVVRLCTSPGRLARFDNESVGGGWGGEGDSAKLNVFCYRFKTGPFVSDVITVTVLSHDHE